MRTRASVIAIILLLIASACDNTGPTKSNNSDRPLAGGGRFANDDPAEGYPDSNGIEYPVIYPGDDVFPIYSSHIDCANSPGERIIDDSAAWEEWWDATTGCQWRGGGMGPDGTMDSNWVPGDSSNPCGGRCETEPPYVDFEQFVVAAIKIEYDSGSFCYRSVWVTDIQEVEGNTTIYYEVSKLDQTCCDMIMAMFIPMGTSPVEAVLIERPITAEVIWVRTNTTQDCQGPDPNEPMTLHYTDAPCALGNGEEIITDSAAWNAWFHTAWACDSARFFVFPYEGPLPWLDPIVTPEDTLPPWVDSTIYNPYPWWGAPLVDFSTHAVIILRSGEQTRWGGGVWLNDIDRSSGGTTFGYTIMQPSEDCPHMGDMGMMNMTSNPTVAIRVPLPIDPPVTWNREYESINCDWGNDTTWVEPWPPGHDSL